MLDPETAWRQYLDGEYGLDKDSHAQKEVTQTTRSASKDDKDEAVIAEHGSTCGPLYISTKTKIGYLNQTIPLDHVFWKVPVAPYHVPAEGVIKKQMKFNSCNSDTMVALCAQVKAEHERSGAHLEEHVLTHIVNPGGRIPFKDVRKISIGLCKKDVTSYRSKRKGAFYNCFVVILRLMWEGRYKEIHVKVFNTGKLEIPGIRNELLLEKAMTLLTDTINPLMPPGSRQVEHLPERSETVLVNSNFSCGFHIDRQELFGILHGKYNISCSYDPCSYPGIQAEFYYDHRVTTQTGCLPSGEGLEVLLEAGHITKISFMVFRTGSVLIVGKCSDETLEQIYVFICEILCSEKDRIKVTNTNTNTNDEESGSKITGTARRARKRTITVQHGGAPATS